MMLRPIHYLSTVNTKSRWPRWSCDTMLIPPGFVASLVLAIPERACRDFSPASRLHSLYCLQGCLLLRKSRGITLAAQGCIGARLSTTRQVLGGDVQPSNGVLRCSLPTSDRKLWMPIGSSLGCRLRLCTSMRDIASAFTSLQNDIRLTFATVLTYLLIKFLAPNHRDPAVRRHRKRHRNHFKRPLATGSGQELLANQTLFFINRSFL
ncbi:hypothetical protein F4808DRAFT_155555 [Astrocystis sublimbata]|nr:hypothetical protein F4808DRAFT_155555 [Astrocystis sublimbata]